MALKPAAKRQLLTKAKLAKELNVSVRTISDWNLLSGSPDKREDGKYALDEWKAWRNSESLKGSELDNRRKQQIVEREDLRIQQQKIDLERKQLDLDERRGELLPVKVIHDSLNDLSQMIRSTISEVRRIHVNAAEILEKTLESFGKVIDDKFVSSAEREDTPGA